MKANLASYVHSHGATPSFKDRENAFRSELRSYQFLHSHLKEHYSVLQMGFDNKSTGYALCKYSTNGRSSTKILKIIFLATKTTVADQYKLHMQIACVNRLANSDTKLCPIELIDQLEKSDNPKVCGLWLEHTKQKHAVKKLKMAYRKGQLFRRLSEAPTNSTNTPHFAICEGNRCFKVLNDQGWQELEALPTPELMEAVSKSSLKPIEFHGQYTVISGIVFDCNTLIGRLPTGKEHLEFKGRRTSALTTAAPTATNSYATSFATGGWMN